MLYGHFMKFFSIFYFTVVQLYIMLQSKKGQDFKVDRGGDHKFNGQFAVKKTLFTVDKTGHYKLPNQDFVSQI